MSKHDPNDMTVTSPETALQSITPSLPNGMGIAKVAATIVAGGGKAMTQGATGAFVKEVITRTAGPAVAAKVLRSGGKAAVRIAPVLAIAEFGIDQAATGAARDRGELTEAQYQRETIGNLGNAAGGLGGAAGGAMLGTVLFPGLGTVIGGLLGGWLGGRAGRAAGRSLG